MLPEDEEPTCYTAERPWLPHTAGRAALMALAVDHDERVVFQMRGHPRRIAESLHRHIQRSIGSSHLPNSAPGPPIRIERDHRHGGETAGEPHRVIAKTGSDVDDLSERPLEHLGPDCVELHFVRAEQIGTNVLALRQVRQHQTRERPADHAIAALGEQPFVEIVQPPLPHEPMRPPPAARGRDRRRGPGQPCERPLLDHAVTIGCVT